MTISRDHSSLPLCLFSAVRICYIFFLIESFELLLLLQRFDVFTILFETRSFPNGLTHSFQNCKHCVSLNFRLRLRIAMEMREVYALWKIKPKNYVVLVLIYDFLDQWQLKKKALCYFVCDAFENWRGLFGELNFPNWDRMDGLQNLQLNCS